MRTPETVRFVCISDSHGRHREVQVPAGDVLIHAGDLTRNGDLRETLEAAEWLSDQPHPHIVLVPGNHDFAFQRAQTFIAQFRERFSRIHLLIDDSTTIDGMPAWGSPWQPWYGGWAYNFMPGLPGEEEARSKWSMIPDSTAILITHCPARGILDRTTDGCHAGCPQLRARIRQLRDLRLHICGHIHEGHGMRSFGSITFVNAAVVDANYRLANCPIIVEMAKTS